MESSAKIYRFSEFTLDLAKGFLFKGLEEIRLRPKVFEALKYLVEHPGRLVTKQELMEAVWTDAFVTDDSLVQCTLELRRALNDREQKILKTVPRRGYLFAAEVTRASTHQDSSAQAVPYDFTDSHERPALSANKRRLGLPVPRTSLIGREQLVAEASELILRNDVRLLSLIGPGGAGKTRLAIAIASAIANQFSGGTQFVNLSSVRNSDLVATAVADALEIRKVTNRTIPELIGAFLQDAGPFLLLLDNFEQVLPAATTVAEMLEACPNLKIIVTSRSSLKIYGEQEFPVTPLPQEYALELFAQRAAAVWPDFAINSDNESVVREICSRLDGLPLAIELAAARTKVFSASAILDRLHSRLQLLTGGPLDLPERQQTLRKAIEWSYGLLSEEEQKLFRRLSVFVGGCSLEAAESVCNTKQDLGIDLFEGLSSLMDKNLLQRVDRSQTEPRFTMLETIREYAFESLMHTDEHSTVRRAQAAYCMVIAEEGNPELSAPDRSRWLSLCDLEIDNLRFALDWLFEMKDLDWTLRSCVALFRFWDMREHMAEGRARLEAVLQMAGNERTRERARVSLFLGALATSQGDYASAERFLSLSLSLYEEDDDQSGIAASLNALAIVARDRGDHASAQSFFERSLACWRLLPDRLSIARCLHNLANVVKVRGDYPRAQYALREAAEIFDQVGDRNGAAWSINQQGDIARAQGDSVAARELYQRALVVFREAGDQWGTARSLTDLASIDCEKGDYLAARNAYGESLEIFAILGHRRGTARALEGAACLALAEGYAARALKLAAAATQLRNQIGAPLHPAERVRFEQSLSPAWRQLNEADAKDVWEEGSAMSLESAIQFSLENPS